MKFEIEFNYDDNAIVVVEDTILNLFKGKIISNSKVENGNRIIVSAEISDKDNLALSEKCIEIVNGYLNIVNLNPNIRHT